MQDAPDIQEAMSEGWTSVEQAAMAKAAAKTIPLVELFGPTVQGEGTVIGQQTYFLRFGLCDYKCVMCDSMHAVNPALVKKNAQWLTQDEIYDKFIDHRDNRDGVTTKWVTFSGGNPAIHDLSLLLGKLKLGGFRVNVETQGTRYQGWLNKVDSLTVSPKGPGMGETHNHQVFAEFIQALVDHASFGKVEGTMFLPDLCFKIVVFDQRDLDFAVEIFHWLKHDSPLNEALKGMDLSQYFYLSLGNPNPPPIDGTVAQFSIQDSLKRYKMLYEDIQNHPVLCDVRWLPQWHAFVWGNDAGH